jgi:hypothetical protein
MTTSFMTRAKLAARLLTRGDLPEDVPSGILPPERREAFDPLTLSTVFRGVQILQTAMVGLPINEYVRWRQARKSKPDNQPPERGMLPS